MQRGQPIKVKGPGSQHDMATAERQQLATGKPASSLYFWSDVFTMLDDAFAAKKLLQYESKARDAVRGAGDLKQCASYLRILVRNSDTSKGSRAVTELKQLWLERQEKNTEQGGNVQALEDGKAEEAYP